MALAVHAAPHVVSTPWGPSQTATRYAPGVIFYSTSSHGGFKVSRERLAEMPQPLRVTDGWYEEDCEAAKVIYSFPSLFSDAERLAAKQTLKQWFPDEWEALTGEVLKPGESLVKDERAFLARHAEDWIVISAVMSQTSAGMVECTATRGGKRGVYGYPAPEQRGYLVPEDEYRERSPFGFVIDEARHRRLDA